MSKNNGTHTTLPVGMGEAEAFSANGHTTLPVGTGKRAILYARVSTDEQAEKGYSLPSQIEACRRYAEAHGFGVAAEVREDHSGAVAFCSRPRGREVAALLKRREANVIVAYQVDRLSRDIVDLLVTCREWLRSDIEIHVCDIGKVESESDILLVIRAWQGTDERKKIAERVSRGRWQKARSGKVVGSGKPPFGYRYVEGELVIDESEARIVRMIFDWYTHGENGSRPIPATSIAKRLNSLRILPPGAGKGWTRKRKDNPKWETTTVVIVISREAYTGVWRYGKRIGRAGRGGKRLLSETAQVTIPVIVSPAQWERAQWQRAQNKMLSPRNNKKHGYLLRGLLFCACGRRMSGRTIDRYCYYQCNRHFTHIPEERTCNERYVRGDKVEPVAWHFVLEVLTADRAQFEAWLKEAQALEQEAEHPQRQRLADVLAMIAECEIEAEKVASGLKKAKGIVSRALERQQIELNDKYAALMDEQRKIESELETEAFTDSDIDAACQFREDVVLGMSNPTFEDKRRVMELLRVTVTHQGGKVTLRCRLPIAPMTIELNTSYSDTVSTHPSTPAYHSHPPHCLYCSPPTR